MLILDKGYTEIRKKYVVHIADYYIPYRQLRNNNIKAVLLNKVQNVIKGTTKDEYIFTIDQEDLFKGLLGDIYLFYIRSLQQGNDYKCIEANLDLTQNWNIVTNYYGAFFDASLLLRLCHRGNIFMNSDYKKELEIIVSTHLGEVIRLESNLFYYVEEMNGSYVLRLTKAENNTHEVVWHKSREIIDDMLLLTNKNSEEASFLESCRHILTNLHNTFPSELRNKVNYQPVYGLDAIDKKIYHVPSGLNWVKEVMSYDGRRRVPDDNTLINLYTAYVTYIHILSHRLVQDYFEMCDREDHLLAQVNKNREQRIVEEAIPFSFD